ncbi:MAG TPA: alpha/beta hydrolase [Labilithrix sp.]|jgi:pimeloyl-ACP methyl ester carboxylesterase|nr:alpha/beta hydrolase [Labilithrix sp.]
MNRNAAEEVVVFVHSTGTGPFLWASVPDGVSGGRRKVLPANLGYPPKPLIARGTRVTVDDDAAEVLRAVPVDATRVHLVAHSYGALVALRTVAELEARLASMFLFEPVVFGSLRNANDVEPDASAEVRSFLDNPGFLHDEESGGRAEWLENFVDYWNYPGAWSKMPAAMREMSLAIGWKMFQEVRSCFLVDSSFEQWRIPAPTTIALGDRTTPSSRAMSRGLARGRANVTLVELPGVGHMAPLTHATHVHEELARHFARLEGGWR